MLCVVNKVATYGFTARLSKNTLETTPMFVLAIMCERFVGRGLKTALLAVWQTVYLPLFLLAFFMNAFNQSGITSDGAACGKKRHSLFYKSRPNCIKMLRLIGVVSSHITLQVGNVHVSVGFTMLFSTSSDASGIITVVYCLLVVLHTPSRT